MEINPLLDIKIEEKDLIRLLKEVKGLGIEKNYLYFDDEEEKLRGKVGIVL